MSSVFERLVRKARIDTLELLDDAVRIANGTAIYMTQEVMKDGTVIEVAISPKFSERISAVKHIKDIVTSKEASAVQEVDELDMLSPFERKKLLEDALDEVNHEIHQSQ